MSAVDSAQQNLSLVLVGHGGYDKLKLQEKPILSPQKDEVLIKIKAAGINFSDLMARQGMYDRAPKLPYTQGLEGSGDVIQLGEGITDFKIGDRVLFMNEKHGCFSHYITIKKENVFKMPDKMSYEEGAALPVVYATSYFMLFDFGNIRKGKSVLIHMAAGGVGIAATQLCAAVGDITVFGTSSFAKHDFIKQNGVTHAIDYRTQDYVTEIRKVCPQGVDVVLDPLAGEDSVKGYNLLKPMGKIIHFGAANMVTGQSRNLMQAMKTWWATKSINPLSLMSQNKAVCGFHMGYLEDKKLIRYVMDEIIIMYNDGEIKPKIDSTWALEDYDLALTRMHDRLNVGKVLLLPDKTPEIRPNGKEKKNANKTQVVLKSEDKDPSTRNEEKLASGDQKE